MKGTITVVTVAILLMPPMITKAEQTVTTIATRIVTTVMFLSTPIVNNVGAAKNASAADAIPLI